MKKVHLIVVGKLKDKNLEALEQDFVKRLKSFSFQITELKASAEQKTDECRSIINKINDFKKDSPSVVIALDELGKEFTSPRFSTFLYQKLEITNQLIFIIGGAEGLNEEVRKLVDVVMCLSKMTMPHKLARLFFIEQLYRAITINEGHPYHN